MHVYNNVHIRWTQSDRENVNPRYEHVAPIANDELLSNCNAVHQPTS